MHLSEIMFPWGLNKSRDNYTAKSLETLLKEYLTIKSESIREEPYQLTFLFVFIQPSGTINEVPVKWGVLAELLKFGVGFFSKCMWPFRLFMLRDEISPR